MSAVKPHSSVALGSTSGPFRISATAAASPAFAAGRRSSPGEDREGEAVVVVVVVAVVEEAERELIEGSEAASPFR